jgi:ABC-2 type transport system ATP-binding protein
MESIVTIDGLTRRYRRTTALNDFSLSVPQGHVLGLVGENGAGKTTLIKHILGMLRAQQGTVRVFGHDPIKRPVDVLGRIGYLSENRDMPGWMRITELKRYCRALYPNWDPQYADELCDLFELDQSAKLRTLSLGQTAKAGLMSALAHRPDLLVLDEPSSGLDPIVRKEILGAIFRSVAHDGRTVLFSSHLLDEVEMAADNVAMVHEGKLMIHESMEHVKESHHRVVVRSSSGSTDKPELLGALAWEDVDGEWAVLCEGSEEDIRSAAAQSNHEIVSMSQPTLDDIFVARAGTPITKSVV